MAGPALAIRRFALAVEAPPARAEGIVRLAERAVRERLPAALAGRLPDAPDDLVLIRRVELDLTLSEGDDERQIAARIADAIAVAIARAAPPPGAGAIPGAIGGEAMPRFAGPAARVAAFLAALAEGRGCDSWWFRSFEGVRVLPPSAAARTVLLRDPAAIAAVFAALDPAARSRLAAMIGAADAGLLLDALAALPSASVPDADWIALAAALRQAGARAPLPRALEALMIMAGRSPAGIAGEVAAAARAAAAALDRSASLPVPEPRAGKRRPRRAAEGERLRARLPEALRAALLAAEDDPLPVPAGTPLFSPLGGYALLLASLFELDLAALSPGWPALSGAAPERGLQLLVLAAAANDRHLLGDPFWRVLLGLPPRLAIADLADWLDAAPPLARMQRIPVGPHRGVALPRGLGPPRARRAVAALARRTLARFAARLPGFASASAPFLRTNLLGVGATLREAEDVVIVRLERPPLDVLLSITGAGEREMALADGRLLRLERRQ